MKKAIILLAAVATLTACKTKERVVESVRTDTCFVDRWQRDSIYIETLRHDSVTIREKGDTILIDRWHTEWRDRWRDRIEHDSIYITQRDTLRVTDIREVEKRLSWWQQTRLRLADLLLVVLSLIVAVKFIMEKIMP